MDNTKKLTKMPALCGLAFLLFVMAGCSSSTLHVVQWVGSFFLDSTTVGAVRVEYYIDSYKAGMDANNHRRDVMVDYYNYSLDTKTLTYVTRLESGITSEVMLKESVRYKKPYLAYTCENGTTQLTLYNIETAEKKVVMKGGAPVPQYFSETGKYLLVNDDGYYAVYSIHGDTMYPTLERTGHYYEAFYIDEKLDKVFANLFLNGTRWFDVKTGKIDSISGGYIYMGYFQEYINNGSAFLFKSDSGYFYGLINEVISNTLILHRINDPFIMDDVNLLTGNICGTMFGNLTIGNYLGKFQTEVINNAIREEK
jgi:hypothetical protein